MRYQVPQFVDIEDKIVGPLTLRQFITYLVAIMILVPVYLMSDLSLFITIAIPVLGVAVLFSHVKIGGRSLFIVIGHALGYLSKGQLFIWQRKGNDKPLVLKGDEYDQFLTNGIESSVSLSDRMRSIETSGNIVNDDIEDIMEEEEIKKV